MTETPRIALPGGRKIPVGVTVLVIILIWASTPVALGLKAEAAAAVLTAMAAVLTAAALVIGAIAAYRR